MEPPSKKPRLSIFDHDLAGGELDTARHNNDMTLKNRFESIFSKYTQDFTGIGDEVDILTGDIVVNNGHLESMETETDAGIDHLAGDFTSTSRSMLRAMTVNLNPDLPGPDDVLLSIEAIAENAALTDEESSNESENDPLRTSSLSSRSRSISVIKPSQHDTFAAALDPYDSDNDSLFDNNDSQSQSGDSLFETNVENRPAQMDNEMPNPTDTEPRLVPARNPPEDDEVIAKFGPNVGKEVLNLIRQRREAHIEPAWRIPVTLRRAVPQQITPTTRSSSPTVSSPEGNRNRSLWALPKISSKRASKKLIPQRKDREESIDPLQEGFTSEPETAQSEYGSSATSGTDDEEVTSDDQRAKNILTETSSAGDCPYCHTNFRNKSGVMAHWDRLLKQASHRIKENDPHDLKTMKGIRANAICRIQNPRLVVYDFRTMIELHEGAGLSWDEVIASKTLRTRKSALQLQGSYNKHRTPPDSQEHSRKLPSLTNDEQEVLRRLCQNPLATISTLRRGLKRRSELEIGNYLADMWLAQLGSIREEPDRNSSLDQQTRPTFTASNLTSIDDSVQAKHHVSHEFRIKQEDSEDELFM